jgi:sec-independent protein translocase protein TatB
MFGMGFTEILLIAIVAILFLGPDKLPDAMVQIAKFFNSVRKTVNEAKSTFEEEMHIKELREEALNYRQSIQKAADDISGFKNAVPDPTRELEEALDVARSGLGDLSAGDTLHDDWDEEEEDEPHDMVTEYKAMAKKALLKAHEGEDLSAKNAPAESSDTPGEPSLTQKAPPAGGFKHLDDDKAES